MLRSTAVSNKFRHKLSRDCLHRMSIGEYWEGDSGEDEEIRSLVTHDDVPLPIHSVYIFCAVHVKKFHSKKR